MNHRRKPTARIRMYRQGLGDCFLISLNHETSAAVHILIDCGVLLGTQDASARMLDVARNIHETTKGRLDVLVATHEHWDHLSGFLQARDVFDGLEIRELWLAWTEDPSDSLANRLRRQRVRALRELRRTTAALRGVEKVAYQRLNDALSFFGAAAGNSTRDALNYLVDHPSRPRVRYHRPGGKPLRVPGVEGLRVFVLGPPRDEKLIRKSSPTKSGHEVYELASRLALLSADAADPDLHESENVSFHAFAPRYRIPAAKAAHMAFFRNSCLKPEQAWRSIDCDLVGAAEELALALDNHTNNTSLVLAFELEPKGRVLLFPGDAQVGNWLSWDQYQWNDGKTKPVVTAADLLKRTVVYKVGHHASHNATAREKGLERMTSGDLVAFIPVDHEMASKKRWNMPFPSLLKRLQELSRGRVLRVDEDRPQQPETISDGLWTEFLRRTHVDPGGLFHEYLC